MNATQLQKNVNQYEKTVRSELQNISHIVSQINLKQFKEENATSEIKSYKKAVTKYNKALNGLKTSTKFLKAQNIMTIQESMELDKLLNEFESEFEETTRYVNL